LFGAGVAFDRTAATVIQRAAPDSVLARHRDANTSTRIEVAARVVARKRPTAIEAEALARGVDERGAITHLCSAEDPIAARCRDVVGARGTKQRGDREEPTGTHHPVHYDAKLDPDLVKSSRVIRYERTFATRSTRADFCRVATVRLVTVTSQLAPRVHSQLGNHGDKAHRRGRSR
jgi:hypothetical protein